MRSGFVCGEEKGVPVTGRDPGVADQLPHTPGSVVRQYGQRPARSVLLSTLNPSRLTTGFLHRGQKVWLPSWGARLDR